MVTSVTIFYMILVARGIFLAPSFLTPMLCSACRDRRVLQAEFVVCKTVKESNLEAIS